MIEVMRRTRGVILIAALAGLLALPAVAGAVILTPTGKAGTNQYYEDVPSAQGPAAPPAGASSGPSTGATARTIDTFGGRRAIARLNRMGKTGRAAAAFDWVWQIGVIPMVAMLLAAVALGGDGGDDRRADPAVGRRGRIATRVVLAAVSVVGVWVVLVPLATTVAVRSSQDAVSRGDIRGALADAATAQAIEPGAASPALQRALILEQLGDVRGALATVTLAERRERDNWRIWLVASRIATEADRPGLALADYRRARSLNPTSLIFRS